ncbi:HNH endonuclease [Micromonospora sp. C28SCA-DRY-2]|uniref:HNH endonuclease n=1 Tax=Micromonospora sp. C28SCA-DRY-2 TaxID=3059522 RepID=UPI002677574F|nr:HNH endonuclease [Micromonospora sp. C28SCA-DRY-2]MDO3705733.1 HNH endonuclease [Micromonospora sp. C28SCA-DRY-2]
MLSQVTGLSRHFTEETLRAYLLCRAVRRDDGCLVVRGYGSRRGVHQKLAGRAWAHVAAFAVFVGGYDPALEVRHLCGVPDCIEPTHLRQVTHAETCRGRRQRSTCRNGHDREVDPATGRYRKVCRICNRDAQQRWRARQAARVAEARAGAGRPTP